jgi:cathepsin L
VRDQGTTCGSCWDFAAVAAYEANFAWQSGREAAASEQYILNGSAAQVPPLGNCNDGGVVNAGVTFLLHFGTMARPTADDYVGVEQPWQQVANPDLRATDGDFVFPTGNPPMTDADIKLLKQFIQQYGAVVAYIYAGPRFGAFGDNNHNGDEVFQEDEPQVDPKFNHVIAIIGWDDSRAGGAWLIKNSWGPTWGHNAGLSGESGYMWVRFGVNSVGAEASWIQASVPTGPVQPPSNLLTPSTADRLSVWQQLYPQFYVK